jgi:hypothetical protein
LPDSATKGVRAAVSRYAFVRSDFAVSAGSFAICVTPAPCTPGGKPVIAVPGESPIFPETTEDPVFVMVLPANTA